MPEAVAGMDALLCAAPCACGGGGATFLTCIGSYDPAALGLGAPLPAEDSSEFWSSPGCFGGCNPARFTRLVPCPTKLDSSFPVQPSLAGPLPEDL